MSNLKASTIVAGNSIFTEFKGALTEQYVLQQLILRYEREFNKQVQNYEMFL